MGLPAEELIIRPFQEVVERGREAVANAHDADADALARAGTALVREGERALKRLQPVWGGQVAKYGNAFKEAILQKDDIEAKRRRLEDLLYDFEDYIEPATFDADKFAELQAATRAFALDVINHAKRLKLALPIGYDAAGRPATAPAEDRERAASPPSTSPSPSPLSPAPPVRGNLKLFPPLPPRPPMPPLSSLPPPPSMPPTSSIPPIPPIPTNLQHENAPRSSSLARRPASAKTATTHTHNHGHGRAHVRNTAPPGDAAVVLDDDAFFDMSHSPEAGNMFPVVPPSSHASRQYSGHAPPAARGVRRISTQSAAARSTGAPASPGGSPTPGTDTERYSRTSSPAGNMSTSGGPAQPRTSATTAWVARQQNGLNGGIGGGGGAAAATRSRASLARARASRDTTMSADSVGSMLSQPYALSTGGTATTAATTASSPSVAGSPLLTDARTSFFSTSYESEDASYAPVLPFIAPPISASVPSAMAAGNRFEDVIQFSPSPVMPPIQLPLSSLRPKTAQAVLTPYETDVLEQTEPESDADPDVHLEPAPVQKPTQAPPVPEPVHNHEPDQDHDRNYDHNHTQEIEQNELPTKEPLSTERRPSVDETTTTVLEPDMPFSHHEVREPDCSIGPQSSFRRMGGFCAGATACRGQGHWRGIELTSGFVGNRQRSIGRCVGCGYAHSYSEVRLDKEKQPEATFNKSGVRFRLRLLYKSHMAKHLSAQRQADSMYGCLFCAESGVTPHEGDATVFTSVNELILHIARHPRPLPRLSGVTVVYGEGRKKKSADGGGADKENGEGEGEDDDGDPDDNDFDLHFPSPEALPWPVPADVAAQSAVAVATQDHMQWNDEKPLARPPPLGTGEVSSNSSSCSISPSVHMTELLPFLAGARIVGVVFPVEWECKWCVGWHGGVAGAFPARLVRIQMPQPNELPMESSSSGMSVVARWRWKPDVDKKDKDKDKDKDRKRAPSWLTFDKGEVISNVQCLYADHWCWAGTNSKGRFGVFPQSHIITSTLQQASRAAPSVRSTKSGWAARSIFHKGGGSNTGSGNSKASNGKAGKTAGGVRPLSGSSSSAKTASSIGWPGY